MLFAGGPFLLGLATVHVPLADVPAAVTSLLLRRRLARLRQACLRLSPPDAAAPTTRLTVLGLNPHAGENGLFGNREEEAIITPALDAARARGIDITGPVPPDTAFIPAVREKTDAYICMTHDQGHIPLKALAFDIAWQGKASPSSLQAAAHLAAKLARA